MQVNRETIQTITEKRTDMSQFLTHWTDRDRFTALLRVGVFVASAARRSVGFLGLDGTRPTIYGSSPAVCFSETPIGNYLQSVDANPRYASRQYGIALPKTALYAYGARPVIYGDMELKERLGSENRYLFCHFRYCSHGDRIDWTHEREWRARPNVPVNQRIGLRSDATFEHVVGHAGKTLSGSGKDVVPMHLPCHDERGDLTDQLPEEPRFIVLVRTEEEKQAVGEDAAKWQQGTGYSREFYSEVSEYRTKYLTALSKARVVSLEEARRRRDREGLWRVEDLVSAGSLA